MNEAVYKPEYEKLQKIGTGSFGTIWKCMNKQTKFVFVLKKLRMDEAYLTMISREIEILRDIAKHERLVKFYGYELEFIDLSMLLYLEFMGKGSLRDVINESGVFTEIQAAKYTKAALEGLDFLHEHNVIHRDIKCGNILLDDKDNVKLTDFGLSKCVEDKSVVDNHTFCGTVNFMAPEIFERNAYSSSVDIWALGVTVVEMLTGKPIFPELPGLQFIQQILKKKSVDIEISDKSEELTYFFKLTFVFQSSKRPSVRDLLLTKFISKVT